jgi:hypothetical protein
MKLIKEFKKQLDALGPVKRIWFTTFNLSIDFFESQLLPIILDMEPPKNRQDYEAFQAEITKKKIDIRVFCDKRMLANDDIKRTAISVNGVSTRLLDGFSSSSLFHPKVVYMQGQNGKSSLGTGSANLTISGWGRNQEVFLFKKVATSAQRKQIGSFFKPLFTQCCPQDNCSLVTGYSGREKKWRFVHSFQEESFIEQLIADFESEELTVWSPYFSKRLTSLLSKLREKFENPNLKFNIVPDRIDGKLIRTQWSSSLKDELSQGLVGFYENPIAKHDNTELCHGKLWSTDKSIAIGSWNMTKPGSNLLESNSEGVSDNNIEAGFIVNKSAGDEQCLKRQIDVNEDGFCTSKQLIEDDIDIPDEVPFDLTVNYDWDSREYSTVGLWIDKFASGYWLKLPDIKERLDIGIGKKNQTSINTALQTGEPRQILANHYYEIFIGEQSVYRGIIIESEVAHRRVQGYDSLDDILNSLIRKPFSDGADPDAGLRNELTSGDDYIDDDSYTTRESDNVSSSYFRMFQAMKAYRRRLQNISTAVRLEQQVFIYPGCLAELKEKIELLVEQKNNDIYCWFLINEFNILVALAIKLYKTKAEIRDIRSLNKKWLKLTIKSLKLSNNINKKYLDLISKECRYE